MVYAYARWGCCSRAFTAYIRNKALKEEEQYWKADEPISPEMPARPDGVFDNGEEGGVWELKPVPPAPTSVLAPIEAEIYVILLNHYIEGANNRFKVGTTGGAPDIFDGKQVVTGVDPFTKKVFTFTENPLTGAAYWDEPGDKQKEPQLEPVAVPKKIKSRKEKYIRDLKPIGIPTSYAPEYDLPLAAYIMPRSSTSYYDHQILTRALYNNSLRNTVVAATVSFVAANVAVETGAWAAIEAFIAEYGIFSLLAL